MMDRSDILKVKSLFNDWYSSRNSRTRIYDRIPSGVEGYEGEMRLVAFDDRVFQFHKVNKKWWSRELGSPDILRWDDLRVAANSVRLPSSDAPTWVSYKGGQALSFSASKTNTIYFEAQIPHGRAYGTPLEPHVHFVTPTANSGDIVFQMTHSWANIFDTFPTETTLSATHTAGGVADQHRVQGLGSMDGTDKTLSSMLICSFARVGGDASDTYADALYFLEFDFHVAFDGNGSINEYVKETIKTGRR